MRSLVGRVLAAICPRAIAFASLAALLPRALPGQIALAPLFSDRAVVQCEKPLPIWGVAGAGEKLTVSFAGQVQTTTAAKDGRWIVVLEPLPASAQGTDLSVGGGKKTIVVHDVVVGEVWLCAGQSDMEFTVAGAANVEHEIGSARFPLLRHVRIEHQLASLPATDVRTGGWHSALSEQVGSSTAVGCFFAREIHQRLGVPVGIVHSSWGGTPVEAWMSPMAIAGNPAFAAIREEWRRMAAAYPAAKANYDARSKARVAAEAAAKARGPKAHAAWLQQNPRSGPPPGDASWAPSHAFNGMISPLLPYAIRGVLWRQGESNADRAAAYQARFAALLTAWRAHFGQGEMPFFWVNLAACRPPDDSTDMSCAWLREAQTRTLAWPNTGQAIAIDLGDPDDIRPAEAREIGRRLALLAKRRVYSIMCDDTGPTFAGAAREDGAMRVRFEHASGGLVAHDKPPQALELAGTDRVFRPAAGKIERDTLLVSSPAVKEPVAVRYAWRNAPDANLYGGSGLPVAPFRSDEW